MSIFSNSYKYVAYQSASDLIPLDARVDTVEDTILTAGQAGESISGAVVFGLGTDMGARGKALIKYAAKPDGYVRGLPTSDQNYISVNTQVLIDAIEESVGESVAEVPWQVAGGANEVFLINKNLKEVYTNSSYFPWPAGNPSNPIWDEQLEFVEIPVVNPVTGSYYVTENLPTFQKAGPLSSQYTFGYTYTDHLNDPQYWEASTGIDLTSYQTGDWIQTKYITASSPEEIQYWTYLIGSGVNPALESVTTETNIEASFMPVAILMQDKVWFNEDPESDLAITTNKLLKKLSINGDEVREDFELQEAEGGRNEAEKWDFFIHFAAPVMSRVRGTLEYLYYFFMEMEKSQQHSYEEYQTFLASRLSKRNGYALPQPISEIRITEGDGEIGYNVRYGWSYIFSKTFPGRWIGLDGQELRNKRYETNLYERTESNDAAYRVGLDQMHGTVPALGKYNDPEKEKTWKNGYHDYVIYTRQNEDETYTRVLCMGLSCEYTINTKEVESGNNGYRFRYAEPRIFDLNSETLDYLNCFRIPIHIGIMNNTMPRIHLEELLQDSATATVLLVDKIKIPWYSTGFFKWLIILIAVVLIVLSVVFPPFLAVAAAFIAGATTGFFFLLVYMILAFAVGFIISMAGALIGGTAGFIFTVIASIVMIYSGALAGAGTFPPGTWGSAMAMLNTTLAYVNVGLNVVNYAVNYHEYKDFLNWYDTAKDKAMELRAAYDLLGPPPDGVDPLDLIDAQHRGATGEYPDEFLGRCKNMNPGLLGYDLVYNFCDICLTRARPGQAGFVEAQGIAFKQQTGAV